MQILYIKKLFETLTAEEEVHQDQFETELDNLEKFGDHYLALQSIERSKSVATGIRQNNVPRRLITNDK